MSETPNGSKETMDLLLVDDEPDFLEPACRYFQRQGYHVAAAANGEQALEVQRHRKFDVAVVDQNMPGMDGLDLLARLAAEDPELKIIVLTGGGTIASAVEAMKRGAVDYLTKPFRLADLDVLIRKASHSGQLEKENQHLRQALARSQPCRRMIGTSPAMAEVRRLIQRVAPSDKPVLIEGESGTGKELVARAIHEASDLAKRPLIVINCAALPETLLESELFGHEKGAFTGASDAKPGLFEVADGGTLFIDEFGELAGSLQAKLLRVLEDGMLRRIGSIRERRVKVRLIAATNRDLGADVRSGRFREDLYYRVNVLSIRLPPLRDRLEDIPLLIRHFLGEGWTVEPGVMEMLETFRWPGNVRQLQNALERAKILADDGVIRLENLPVEVRQAAGLPIPTSATHSNFASGMTPLPHRPSAGDPVDLESLSRMHVLEVLRRNGGNKAKSARALGIGRRSLYRLLEKFGEAGSTAAPVLETSSVSSGPAEGI